MTPWRLIRPTVGLMPTSMFWFDGLRIDPDVSVPMFAAARFAEVAIPELEPPVASAGRPSANGKLRASGPGRGSCRGSHGLYPYLPTALEVPGMASDTQLGSSV